MNGTIFGDLPPGLGTSPGVMPETVKLADELEFNESKVLEELKDKRSQFEARMQSFLSEANEYANAYRLIPSSGTWAQDKLEKQGLPNTQVPHTTRSIETLSTMQYAMMTAANPNFEAISQRPDVDIFSSLAIAEVLRYQQNKIEFNRKLLKGLRSLNLFGTTFFELPYIASPSGTPGPTWESTDFQQRSIHQVGFSPNAFDLETADWKYTMDFMTPWRLRRLSKMDELETTWKRDALEEAIEMSKESDNIPVEIKSRLSQAGYAGDYRNNLELMTWYGPLESLDTDKEVVCAAVNLNKVVRLHLRDNEFNSGMDPFLSAHFIEFEMEPYGYGVGRLTRKIQSDLNANRNRYIAIITFALFNMWKVSRFAGIKPGQLRIRPWHAVEMDDMNGLEPIRPQIEAVNFGIKLEEILKDDFETLTGATKNLQAVTTDATATEARITQAEAVRRIAVGTEIIADRLIRGWLYRAHKNNMQFLDRDLYLRISGEEKPTRISPADIRQEVDFELKLVTDKDFRPKRLQQMTQFLQILTSLRNFVPEYIDPGPLIIEIARDYGINPKKIIRGSLPPPQGNFETAQRLAQAASLGGALSKEQGLRNSGLPGNIG